MEQKTTIIVLWRFLLLSFIILSPRVVFIRRHNKKLQIVNSLIFTFNSLHYCRQPLEKLNRFDPRHFSVFFKNRDLN